MMRSAMTRSVMIEIGDGDAEFTACRPDLRETGSCTLRLSIPTTTG